MTEIDWIICALLVLSTVVGIMRGVIREVLSIVGWVAGFMLSMSFAGEIADRIPLDSIGYIPRVIIAAVLILVACLFVVGLFGFILRKMLEVAALTFEDRILGAAFGFVRGIIVVDACLFFFGLSQSLSSSRMWQQSVMIGPAETVIEWSMPYMPEWIRALRGTKVTGL